MYKFIFVTLLAVFTVSYSIPSYRTTLTKCSIKDMDCLRDMTEKVIRYVGEYGIPEMGIQVHDPYVIQNETVKVAGIIDVSMIDGVVEGIKDCAVESMYTNIEEGITIFDTFCEKTVIKGKYQVKSSSFLDQVFGKILSGEGTGSIVMEKLRMKYITPYHVEMNDGEYYVIPDTRIGNYSFEMENVIFNADQLSFGTLEIAPAVTAFLNRNWEYIMKHYGRHFSDKGYSFGHDNIYKFFSSIPAKEYLVDDLSPYVKNEEKKSAMYNRLINSMYKF